MVAGANEQHWNNDGVDLQAATTFLNRVVSVAETGEELLNAARAVAGFGPRFVNNFSAALRGKVLARVKKLNELQAEALTPKLASEAAQLGEALGLID